jgi:hypothetical protein
MFSIAMLVIPRGYGMIQRVSQELGLGMMAALCTGVQLNLIAEPFVAFSKARDETEGWSNYPLVI